MSLIIVIRNTTQLAPISDYEYEVLVGDGTAERSLVLEIGTLKGHVRDEGWRKLLSMLVDKADCAYKRDKEGL